MWDVTSTFIKKRMRQVFLPCLEMYSCNTYKWLNNIYNCANNNKNVGREPVREWNGVGGRVWEERRKHRHGFTEEIGYVTQRQTVLIFTVMSHPISRLKIYRWCHPALELLVFIHSNVRGIFWEGQGIQAFTIVKVYYYTALKAKANI